MTDIIFAGFGGQGVLTTGQITAESAMRLGKNVTWYPSYGSQMRGGTANCTVKISDGDIASPYASELDMLVAMNVASVDKFQAALKPGALMMVDAGDVPENYPIRDDITCVRVPVNDVAHECGNPKGANLVMLGTMTNYTDLFPSVDKLVELVDEYFMHKKGKTFPKNADCIRAGAKY
jgi:2-oxoglutarate ferredoxin oxidoreductase subunit gamma